MVNILDKLILGLSPRRGLNRIKARTAAAAVMNYDAASKGRRTYGWKAPATAADAAGRGGRTQLRNLSRDMIRNRPFAARAREVVTLNVVGNGIKPSVDVSDPEAADTINEVLRDHLLTPAIDAAGVHNLYGLQAQVMNAVFSDGEVLVRYRPRTTILDPHLRLGFQVELLEADHLDETVQMHGKNEVVDGIEYGPTGAPVAYHLFRRHPGAIRGWRRGLVGSETERVPAGQVLHIRRLDRPGQGRGIPWLAPVLMTLGELSDYQEAQILKQRMAALLALIVETDADGEAYKGADLNELQPGAVVGTQPGQKVTTVNPPEVTGYDEFMRGGLRAVAMGIGLSYEAISGDMSQANFTQGRMGRMEMDRAVQAWQQLILILQFCDGIGRWTADAWGLARRQNRWPEFPARLEWTAPRRPLIDPTKEIKAAEAEINAGLTSRQRKQRELGYDPEVIRRERAEDARRDREADEGAGPAAAPPQQDPPPPPQGEGADETQTQGQEG